jgi:putative flippase GtrA
MDTIIQGLNAVLDLFRSGFNQVNAVLGLVIALIAAFQLTAWKKLWEMALAALAFHIVALMLAPAIDHGAAVRLPALMEPGTWRNWLAIYIGYTVLIALFYFLRTRLLRPSAAHH